MTGVQTCALPIWLPDDVQFVDAIPHTATGKLQKTTLRAKYKDHYVKNA